MLALVCVGCEGKTVVEVREVPDTKTLEALGMCAIRLRDTSEELESIENLVRIVRTEYNAGGPVTQIETKAHSWREKVEATRKEIWPIAFPPEN